MDTAAKISSWYSLLKNDKELSEEDRLGFEAPIKVYLRRCAMAKMEVGVASAKEFVQKVVPTVLGGFEEQEIWRRALRWFFGFDSNAGRRLKEWEGDGKNISNELKPHGQVEQGLGFGQREEPRGQKAPKVLSVAEQWGKKLEARLRGRNYAASSVESYVGWAVRWVKWLEERGVTVESLMESEQGGEGLTSEDQGFLIDEGRKREERIGLRAGAGRDEEGSFELGILG
jgi:hypothetical protein